MISARFPTRRNVYRDDYRPVVDGTGLEQQRRRPLPAAETGRSCWGSILIFQSPAKGLRKNQLTQPVRPRRFPTRRNVYRDDYRPVVDGTGLEQQRRRPLPAAETGRSCWGSILIFQSPAKGLRKNQLTQPVRPRRFPTRRNVYRDDYRLAVDGTGLEQGGSAVSSLQISLYRGCSFLGGCDILGLVQQIGIWRYCIYGEWIWHCCFDRIVFHR